MLLSQVSPPLVLVEVQSMLGILIELLVLLFAPPKFPPWDLNKHYTFVLMLHLLRFLKSSNRTGKRGTITKLHPKNRETYVGNTNNGYPLTTKIMNQVLVMKYHHDP